VLEADVVTATLIRMAASAARGVHGLGISRRAPPRAGRCRNGLPLTKVARKAQALPNFVGNVRNRKKLTASRTRFRDFRTLSDTRFAQIGAKTKIGEIALDALICLFWAFYVHFRAIINSMYIGFESRRRHYS
jgi:hypothetical protein